MSGGDGLLQGLLLQGLVLQGRLPDAAATDRLGAALAAALRPGDTVFLIGELGAGKSALARAVIRTLLAAEGRQEDMPSPTYTLTQSYRTRAAEIVHADLYRLSDATEAAELGLGEDVEGAIRLIEWPERLGALTPARRLEIELGIPETGQGRLMAARFLGAETGADLGADWRAVRAAIGSVLAAAEAGT